MRKLQKEGTIANGFEGLIGISRKDITPIDGIYTRNWGAGESHYSKGVHRPLELVCLTLQSATNDAPAIMISADLGWWKTPDEEAFLRKSLISHFKLKEANLMICLSHTHSGPSLSLADSSKKGGDLIQPYLDFLLQSCVEAIEMALKSRFLGVLDWHYGNCGLATNRDLYEEKSNRYLVGFNPYERGDETLLVGRIRDKKEKIRLVLVNYACHPTTLAWENHLISPDFVGSLRELVKGEIGGEVMFLQGASGDLAPSIQYVGDLETADAYGRQLGYAVLSILQESFDGRSIRVMQKVVESGASLAIWRNKEVDISTTLVSQRIYVELPVKDLPSINELESIWHDAKDSVVKERLWRKIGLRKIIGEGPSYKLPVWIWKIGNAFIVGQCTEAYSFFQKELRKMFYPIPVAVINIVNGYIGYLPTANLYNSDAYAVWQTPFEKGSLETLESEVATAIKKLNTN